MNDQKDNSDGWLLDTIDVGLVEPQNTPEDIPSCLGYSDAWNGDYDYGYGVPWTCEECLCNWDIGGTMDPRKHEEYCVDEAEEI